MSAKRKAESELRAASRPRVMKPHSESRADSERDSGFSDASSEHTGAMDNTDSEDSPRPFLRPEGQRSASGQLAVLGGSYSSMSPMIIMNNVLLKQQPGESAPPMKPWSFSPTVEVVQPVVQQPQVVFLQPVVSRQASKEAPRHRRPKKYLPILKSYPKIAPHPGDTSSSGRGTASSSSSSSCSSSGSQREHGPREEQQQQQKSQSPVPSATPDNTRPPQTRLPQIASEAPSPATDQSEVSQSFSSRPPSRASVPTPPKDPSPGEHKGVGGDDDGSADTRRKRFCNTYNILSKSGLLDITLRTKELLRQNRRTQTDLDRLREHTDLFLQALRSGDAGICVKLHASLQEEDGKPGAAKKED
ncbi:CLOCK-interacting pacemaker [Syngnathoides biaculeatus]|uniref:CLOCK-interacting pacemaker n=1 Tax=Syngnathoides biaculeatus TaxID=300417 RepID=UPI002ADDF823|nr:CLOCK-interacting pacemaker [Syngnathoides biaculeatus]